MSCVQYMLAVWVCVISLFHQSKCTSNYVTCSSVLKLQHVRTGHRLHSHEVNYGSGSGQQSVTGTSHADDVNSYWTIKGLHGEKCTRGDPVKCGDVIRLQHLQTHKYLHSHYFQSPLSHNQEVSAFGGEDGGDSGDNWRVVCDYEYWNRDSSVRLQHVDTGMYLHSTGHQYGRPIAGQKEISGYKYATDDNLWKAMEGVYLKADAKAV